MKRVASIVSAAMVLVASPMVRAEDTASYALTDAQIAQVRTRCVEVQGALTRIRANDGLRRVNLGQQYETISTRLMAPFNSRVALNKLDGVELTKTTVDFNKQLDVFREKYRVYEQDISSVIDMKCQDQPVSFYDGVMKARSERAAVKESVEKLNGLLAEYNAKFEDLAKIALSKKGAEQ